MVVPAVVPQRRARRRKKFREPCAYYNGHSAPKLEAAILEHRGQYSDSKKVKQLLNFDGRRDI
jgi:hypothetical protein